MSNVSKKTSKNKKSGLNKNQTLTIALLIAAFVIMIAFAAVILVRENLTSSDAEKESTASAENTTVKKGDEKVIDQFAMPAEGEEIAHLKTNYGDIYIRLLPDAAPKAVENFTTHIKEGYYNGVTFHRVMNNFMIQGGDPEGTGRGGESIWGAPFEDEFNSSVRNYRGALSMANSGANTNGSQFFIVQAGPMAEDYINKMISSYGITMSDTTKKNYINYGGTPWLDDVHTVFGQVIKGMDVVDAIAGVDTDSNSKPLKEVVIEKAEILEYKASDFEK